MNTRRKTRKSGKPCQGVNTCPACGEAMTVTQLTCPSCGTEIRGNFQPNEFAFLPEDKLEFLRLFLKLRGNLTELAKELGVSYPTARVRFDELMEALGYGERAGPRPEVEKVLNMLEKGEITPEEAERLLRGV